MPVVTEAECRQVYIIFLLDHLRIKQQVQSESYKVSNIHHHKQSHNLTQKITFIWIHILAEALL